MKRCHRPDEGQPHTLSLPQHARHWFPMFLLLVGAAAGAITCGGDTTSDDDPNPASTTTVSGPGGGQAGASSSTPTADNGSNPNGDPDTTPQNSGAGGAEMGSGGPGSMAGAASGGTAGATDDAAGGGAGGQAGADPGAAGQASAGGVGGTGSGTTAGAGGQLASGATGGSAANAGAAGAGAAGDGVAGAGGMGSGGATADPGYQPCPESGPCKIMPFGDSITESCCNYNGGYRVELFRLALAASQEITFVGSLANGPDMVDGMQFPRDHEGHGGFTIQGGNGIQQFVMPSLTNYQPDIITLMIGTNDINGNNDLQNAPNRLGELLDSIFTVDPDVLVVLAQIVPTQTDGTNQRVMEYNARLPALVDERTAAGRHLILVDMYQGFTQDANYKQSLLGDNLHPNDAGYARMGEIWYEAIEQYLR